MNKLGLDALKERAKAIASTELLASITGGNENACHDNGDEMRKMREKTVKDAETKIDNTYVAPPHRRR